MLIFQGGEYETSGMSPDQFQQKMEQWNKWVNELREDDLFVNGHALKNSSKQINDENLVLTDGPFVELNELVTGYFVIKAKDLDHARQLSKGYPDFDLGGKIQIREIQTF